MKNVNDYAGATDNERIEAAIRDRGGEAVVIPPRKSSVEPERHWWRLDRAILLPSDTTVILENCRIKLSDVCRDNFFRSANCGLGIEEPERLANIHIQGVGRCVLEGADHPRSTGDSSKLLACPCPKNFGDPEHPTFNDLHRHSYGTDAGKAGESQTGDWRNIGILMANVDHLSIENLHLVEQHAWGISLEACTDASVRHIDFKACMTRVIDGARQNNENQDGVNLRNGCENVVISDITGTTGDDVVALTCIASEFRQRKAGSLENTQVLSNDWTKREKGIRNVIIRNILASPAGGCLMIRLLATDGAEIRNVVIDGVIDNSPDGFHTWASVEMGGGVGLIGEPGYPYGTILEKCLFNITVSNVISNANCGVAIHGGLVDSAISNVISRNPAGQAVHVDAPELLVGVKMTAVGE